MKKITVLFVFLLFVIAAFSQTNALNIYVSTVGRADAAGSLTKPVNSISKAIEIAETSVARQTAEVKEVNIFLRRGTYFVNNTIEIIGGVTWDSKVPLNILSYNNEKVSLHGGEIIPVAKLQTVTDKSYISRFRPNVAKRVRVVSLQDVDAQGIGKLKPAGFGRQYAPARMELFLDGVPGKIARWPNDSTVAISKIIDSGSIPIKGDKSNRGGVFTYSKTARPSLWKEPQKAWISGYFNAGYADDAVPLKGIDTVNHVISTSIPTIHGFASGKRWQGWYAYNLPEEIDVPGEYYIDEDKRMLYFLPPSDLKKIEVSILETPLIAIDQSANVSLKNIYFTCARGMGIYLNQSRDVRIQGCTFSNLGLMAVYISGEKPVAELKYKRSAKATNKETDSSAFIKSAGNINIVDCEIYQMGAGGIVLDGGERSTLKAGNSFVTNCSIHDFNRIEKSYRPGILISGVGNHISNCDIYNAPSMAILLHGNNHIIEYNNIHHVALEVNDQGALYYGRDPSERGMMVRYNYFHELGNKENTTAIYHDDGACGMEVFGNVFYKTGKWASLIGGGSDNPYTNNIFISNEYAMHIDNRLQSWVKGWVEKNGLFEKDLNAVNYSAPPYSLQYPHLLNYWEDNPAMPKRNTFSKNVLVNITHPIEGDSSWLPYESDNFEVNQDPGFVDFANQKFSLKTSSEVWTKVPGFKPIPFENIGYQKK